jgi:WD40 repeat protein
MAVAIAADGKTGLSASFDYTIRLWNLETGAARHVFQTRGGAVTSLAVTPDFRRAVSGSEGPWLEVWDLESCTSIAAFRGDGEFRGTAISVDGGRIFASDQLGRIHIFELRS